MFPLPSVRSFHLNAMETANRCGSPLPRGERLWGVRTCPRYAPKGANASPAGRRSGRTARRDLSKADARARVLGQCSRSRPCIGATAPSSSWGVCRRPQKAFAPRPLPRGSACLWDKGPAQPQLRRMALGTAGHACRDRRCCGAVARTSPTRDRPSPPSTTRPRGPSHQGGPLDDHGTAHAARPSAGNLSQKPRKRP